MGNNKTGWFGGRLYDSGVSGIVGRIGQPGTGKSFGMAQAVKGCNRVVVFNTVRSYGNSRAGCRLPGFVELETLESFVAFMRRHRLGRFRVLYSPRFDAEAHFEAVARLLLEVRNVVFAVDEIWHFQKPGWSPEPLKCMMLTGRHYGISLHWTAQRPAEVHRTLTSVSNELYVGRLQETADLTALRGRLAPEALAKLPSLPNRTFIHKFDDGRWEVVK